MSINDKKEDLKSTDNPNIFSIVCNDNNQLIGHCWFHKIDKIKATTSLAIFIGETSQRGSGFGQEAVGILVEFGFKYLNLHNIMLEVYEINQAGINCYKKVGFKEIGRRRESYYVNGKYYDTIYMDILSNEFIGEYIKNKFI